MSVADLAETEYIADCILAELALISPQYTSRSGDPFFTQIGAVVWPDFEYTDEESIMAMTPTPAALLWLIGIGPDAKGNNFQERRQFLRAVIIGYVGQDRGVQRAALRFADDIDRTMLGNPMRKHPQQGALANNYGVMTAQTGTQLPISLTVQQPLNQYARAIFACQYDITFRAPS